MNDNQEEPITPGCPSLMPHNLPGGFDGVEPGEDKEQSAVKKYPPYDDRALPKYARVMVAQHPVCDAGKRFIANETSRRWMAAHRKAGAK